MKYFIVSVLVVCVSMHVCLAAEAVVPASRGVLVVEVTNGTANGAPLTGDEVIVGIYENMQFLHNLNGKVAADGKVVFEDVPLGDNFAALTRVKHQDMMFNGHPVILKAAENEHIVPVQVFDVSQDKSGLSVEVHHIIIKARSESLEISEYMQLKNSSDMAVSSDKKDDKDRNIILEIMLPRGFRNLQSTSYFEESALVVTERGFYDTMAVPPGQFPANFSYTLDITSGTMDIAKGITLPTTNLMIFAELGQAKLHGLGQPEDQIITSDGTPMEYYKLKPPAPADEVTFQIVGFNVGTSDRTTWMILSLTFAALAVLLLLRLRPGRADN